MREWIGSFPDLCIMARCGPEQVLTGDETGMTKIAVIGGGIAGVSVAGRLAPHAQVTVFEAESALGYHASGRSAALFEPRYGKASTVALSLAGEPFFVEGDYLSPRGVLFLAKADERAVFEQDVRDMLLEEITPDAALELVPILNRDRLAFAARGEQARDIDTDRLIQDFAKEVRHHGGALLMKAPVTGLERQKAGWKITAGDSVMTADIVINAAGAWADRVAAMAGIAPLGITPYRRSVARVPAPDGHDISAWPVMFGVGESWYAKPDAGQLIVSPADEDPTEPHDAWADDMVLAEGIARYEEMVTEPVTRVTANWAGLRSFAPDRQLVLGPSVQDPSFVWHAAQGGYGFQTAPGASQLTADLILGRPPELPEDMVAALSPTRFS